MPELVLNETTADMDILVLIEKNMTKELKQLISDSTASASAMEASSQASSSLTEVQVGR